MTEIPDSVKSRILKMMALANDERGNEHVAAIASAKIQALLAEYNLELSQITGSDDENPDAVREKVADAVQTNTDWQRSLLFAIAENNFCYVFRDYNVEAQTFSMVGRRININTTIQIYTYLTGAIMRLNPFVDRRTRSYRSWQEGCAVRLCDRLYDQRRQSEAASKAAQTSKATNPDTPRGNGTDIVLSDIYSSENDLNRDLRFGYPPGQTARERAEWEARYAKERAEREANPPPAPEPIKETEAQRRRRKAKEQAAYTRSWTQYQKRQEREAAKRDAAAFNMGHNAGGQISLDQQISQKPMTVAIA